ncbi:substrate-binding domain-containing protein [Treponema primitia]|uniref:substrate-binding domain-containing protein n=1 Tax=Treponema primitia TaxID=88058 RepID=UPI0002555172|nr:substrate-binding domain-containing protein [Treponema primitia]
MKTNIKTISAITGFSQATISNVLNNKRGVNSKTTETILKVAKETGYLNSTHITSIKLVMYKKSGLVLTNTPLIAALLDGVESEGHAHGLDTKIVTIKEGESGYRSKLEQLIRERNSGIILLATELEWADMRPFLNTLGPIVVLDAWFREGNFDTVLMNNSDSLYVSVTCLVENGHHEIGYIDSSVPIRNFYYRKNGFIRAMESYGLKVDNRYCISLGPTSNDAYEDMCRYLQGKHAIPTAYCVVNDIITFGAMKALQEFGYRIPDDVSLIGFDNMPFCDMTSPPLTTINVLKRELGQVAVRRLLALCDDGEEIHTKTQLLTTLVPRGSVKKLVNI